MSADKVAVSLSYTLSLPTAPYQGKVLSHIGSWIYDRQSRESKVGRGRCDRGERVEMTSPGTGQAGRQG